MDMILNECWAKKRYCFSDEAAGALGGDEQQGDAEEGGSGRDADGQ